MVGRVVGARLAEVTISQGNSQGFLFRRIHYAYPRITFFALTAIEINWTTFEEWVDLTAQAFLVEDVVTVQKNYIP